MPLSIPISVRLFLGIRPKTKKKNKTINKSPTKAFTSGNNAVAANAAPQAARFISPNRPFQFKYELRKESKLSGWKLAPMSSLCVGKKPLQSNKKINIRKSGAMAIFYAFLADSIQNLATYEFITSP